jgi:hypothetical protein
MIPDFFDCGAPSLTRGWACHLLVQHRQNTDIPKQGTARYCGYPMVRYYRNDHLHRDLKKPTIRQEILRFAGRHERRIQSHVNTEVLQLLDNTNLNRRLKRIRPFELCSA